MMNRIFLVLLVILSSCGKDKKIPFETNTCKRQPPFYERLGFKNPKSGMSTSERNTMGVVLIDFSTNPFRTYQDPTWSKAGWMGPLTWDAAGNTFVGPAPKINVLDNPTKDQNILYRIDGMTAQMEKFIDLPTNALPNEQNPYGILGMTYMCTGNILFVSSVMGSDRENERGIIYSIDLTNKKIIDKLENVDAMGLGVSYISGYRKLYIGKNRNSDLYSVNINEDGTFNGSPKFEISLAGFGVRGDDKIKKVTFNNNHEMELSLLEFNFNLIAPTEKQEAKATLVYDYKEEKWLLKQTPAQYYGFK